MSGGMGEGMCPLCDGQMLTYFETRPHDFVTGVCLECGYCYWTELGVRPLELLNDQREEQGLKPLKKLKTNLKALDQLRREHGLEPLEELLITIPKVIERIRKEVKR